MCMWRRGQRTTKKEGGKQRHHCSGCSGISTPNLDPTRTVSKCFTRNHLSSRLLRVRAAIAEDRKMLKRLPHVRDEANSVMTLAPPEQLTTQSG